MKKIFTISLMIIGAVIGFILGMTMTFAMNSSSFLILAALCMVFAILGGVGLAQLAPYLDGLENDIQKILTILCAVVAIILLLFLVVSLLMLKSYYQIY